MAVRSAFTTPQLLLRRFRAHTALLVSMLTTMTVGLATAIVLLAALQSAARLIPHRPGVTDEALLTQASTGRGALLSATPALIVLVLLISATAVAQLARLIAAAREQETTTVRARGLSSAQAWMLAALESLGIALVAALLAMAVAFGVATLLDFPLVLAQWPVAMIGGVVLAATSAIALRRGERPLPPRSAKATAVTLVIVVLLAAGLVLWQLPQARNSGFDPIVAIAPAVLLLACAIVALAVCSVVSAVWARTAPTAPGFGASLSARRISRQIPLYATVVLLVAFASAQLVFTAGFSATWQHMVNASAGVRAGANLSVTLTPQSVTFATMADAAAATEADVTAALVTDVELGAVTAHLVAVPSSAVDTVVSDAQGLINLETLGTLPDAERALRVEPILLEGVQELEVSADLTAASGLPATITLVAVLLDANGTPALAAFRDGLDSEPGQTVTRTSVLEIPEGVGPFRLVGVVAKHDILRGSEQIDVSIRAATGDQRINLAGTAQLSSDSKEAVLWTAGTSAAPVGVAISEQLAARLSLRVGDVLEYRYGGSGRVGKVVVVHIVPAIPGTHDALAMFAPLENLVVSQLQRGTSVVPANAIWAAGGDPGALSAALGDRPVLTSQTGIADDIIAALVPGWWIVSTGSLVLALVASFAIGQTMARRNARELGVLRALGVNARQQGRMRFMELSAVFATALVLGSAAEVVLSAAVIPTLVWATTPGLLGLATGVRFAWIPLGVATAVLAVGLAAAAGVSAAFVSRAARTATVGDEAR